MRTQHLPPSALGFAYCAQCAFGFPVTTCRKLSHSSDNHRVCFLCHTKVLFTESHSSRQSCFSSVRHHSSPLPHRTTSTYTTSFRIRTCYTLLLLLGVCFSSLGVTASASASAARFAPRASKLHDVYDYAFQNGCSKRFLKTERQQVTASGNSSVFWFGPYDWRAPPNMLLLKHGGKHICFDKRSRLVVQETASFEECNFMVQNLPKTGNDLKVILKLASRPEWAIGFRKNGEPFLGRSYVKRRQAARKAAAARTKEPDCFVFDMKVEGRAAATQWTRPTGAGAPSVANRKIGDALKRVTFVPRTAPQRRVAPAQVAISNFNG